MLTTEKKTPLNWACAVLILGISVVLTNLIPGFGFIEGAGIFLMGTGIASLFIQLFVEEEQPVQSLCLLQVFSFWSRPSLVKFFRTLAPGSGLASHL